MKGTKKQRPKSKKKQAKVAQKRRLSQQAFDSLLHNYLKTGEPHSTQSPAQAQGTSSAPPAEASSTPTVLTDTNGKGLRADQSTNTTRGSLVALHPRNGTHSEKEGGIVKGAMKAEDGSRLEGPVPSAAASGKGVAFSTFSGLQEGTPVHRDENIPSSTPR